MPDWDNMEIALLRVLDECGGEARCRKATWMTIRKYTDLPKESIESKLLSGDLRMPNSVRWTRKKLILKGELNGSKRGTWMITPLGRKRLEIEGRAWEPKYHNLIPKE
jgi:hypothetical protein